MTITYKDNVELIEYKDNLSGSRGHVHHRKTASDVFPCISLELDMDFLGCWFFPVDEYSIK